MDPEDRYNVTFEGLQKNLDALQVSNIIASADLQNILEQTDPVGDHYHVVLDFESEGSRVNVSTPVQVWIKLNDT